MLETNKERKYKQPRVLCPYCNKEQSEGNLTRHKKTCQLNPENQVKGYILNKENNNSNEPLDYETLSKCQYCNSIFTNTKDKVIHEKSCAFNPLREASKINDNFDKLRILKEQFPKIYDLLTSQQIKEYLDSDMTGYKIV